MSWLKRWKKRVRALVHSDAVEAEMDEELAFHLEMETQKNLRAGMSPVEARRQAAIQFGGVEKYKDEVRDARMLGWVSGMSLDFKLGARMLVKYPGLTLVGGLAMAFAIAASAATFELVRQVIHPTLPLADGGRVVGIRTWDAAAGAVESRVAGDFAAWRRELRSVGELGAFRTVQRNLITPDGQAQPVVMAEMTASGFRVARVAPLMGRYLVDEDEREGAAPVVVLGEAMWRSRFGADPAIVGRSIRLGRSRSTVVGVMPASFGFPVNHRLWTPLRLGGAGHEGPRISVFGRLAPGATLASAQAELAASGARAAAAAPATHRHRRPHVLPYTRTVIGMNWKTATAMMYSMNASVVMFLVLVCANVAALVFARTATRESELVVRTALGASRGRIVMQLFTEALVMGGAAAVVGLAVAAFALRWAMGLFESLEGELPFWISAGLSPWTVLYTVLLTTLAAVMAGVVPGRKATGREVQSRLRQGGVGGGSLRFGRLWTGIIVTQVALTAAFVPIVIDTGLDTGEIQNADTGLAAGEFLSARLEMDAESSGQELGARTAATLGELKRRLEAEPGVVGVTAGSKLPGGYHPRRAIEIDGEAAPLGDEAERKVQTGSVDPDYFQVLGAPIVLGRGFHPADLRSGQRVVIVNQSFAREVLGGRSPVGRRVRYTAPPGDGEPTPVKEDAGVWYEIVGVSGELTMTVDPDLPHNAGIYHPAAQDGGEPIHVAVHLRGEPESFAPRLRALATAVDPSLRLYEIRALDQAQRETLLTYTFWLKIAGVACGIVLLLSILGIYSILSFTVARRTREIGIRVALGADRRRIVGAIFARAFRQVGLGIAIGAGLLVLIGGGIHSMYGFWLITGGMALMVAATMLACIVPTRRALGVEPTEAMRADV